MVTHSQSIIIDNKILNRKKREREVDVFGEEKVNSLTRSSSLTPRGGEGEGGGSIGSGGKEERVEDVGVRSYGPPVGPVT